MIVEILSCVPATGFVGFVVEVQAGRNVGVVLLPCDPQPPGAAELIRIGNVVELELDGDVVTAVRRPPPRESKERERTGWVARLTRWGLVA